ARRRTRSTSIAKRRPASAGWGYDAERGRIGSRQHAPTAQVTQPISSAEFGGETGVWRGGVLECAIQCAMALVTTWHDLAQRGTTSRRWLGAAAGEPAEPTSPHLGRGRRDRGHPWWPTLPRVAAKRPGAWARASCA